MAFVAEDFRSRSVRVHAKSVAEVREWCCQMVPADKQPLLTARELPNQGWVIRATFPDSHYASIFRMFWDGV